MTMTYVTIMHNITSYPLFKYKIMKIKIKQNKIKISSLFITLTSISSTISFYTLLPSILLPFSLSPTPINLPSYYNISQHSTLVMICLNSYILFWFDLSFSFLLFFFYFLDNKKACDYIYMMYHMMWCHRFRIW